MIDCALPLRLIGDKDVLAIQVENTELFGIPMRHRCVAIVQHSIPA